MKSDYEITIIKELLEHKQWLTSAHKEKIRESIEKNYSTDRDVLSLFVNTPSNLKLFISKPILTKFVSSLKLESPDQFNPIQQDLSLIIKCKSQININIVKISFEKIQEFLTYISQNLKEHPDLNAFFHIIEDYLLQFDKFFSEDSMTPTLNNLSKSLHTTMNTFSAGNSRNIFIPSFFYLMAYLDESQKRNFNNNIIEFIDLAELPSITDAIDRFQKKRKKEFIDKYINNLKSRSLKEQTFFDHFYPLISNDAQSKWLVDLIPLDHTRALSKLSELKYKTSNIKQVVSAFLEISRSLKPNDMVPIFEALNIMKCAKDPKLTDNYLLQIADLLKINDAQVQDIGHNAFEGSLSYLSKTEKRNFALKVIEWLRSQGPSTALQPRTTDCVVHVWTDLQPTPQNDFVDFIVRKLILDAVNAESVNYGFQILSNIDITKSSNYSTYFDDIEASYDTQTDDNIKNAIKAGLSDLSKTTK